MEFRIKSVPKLEVEVDAGLGIKEQLAYVGAEFRKWCMGLPKGFKASLNGIEHRGDFLLFRYEAMDSRP